VSAAVEEDVAILVRLSSPERLSKIYEELLSVTDCNLTILELFLPRL
jgi:hypothetical protein